jgi:hypothetical protein
MLAQAGLSEVPAGEIRIFADGQPVVFEHVKPWDTIDHVYIPIEPLLAALGADVAKDAAGDITVTLSAVRQTVLRLDESYFTHENQAIMPLEEIICTFPYVIEWVPELGVIAAAKGGAGH